MVRLLKDMGALRCLLHAGALLLVALMPFASAPGYSADWHLFFSGIVPATAPLFFVVLALDMLMSQVWKSGAPPARRAVLNRILLAHLATASLLLASWLAAFLPDLLPP